MSIVWRVPEKLQQIDPPYSLCILCKFSVASYLYFEKKILMLPKMDASQFPMIIYNLKWFELRLHLILNIKKHPNSIENSQALCKPILVMVARASKTEQ